MENSYIVTLYVDAQSLDDIGEVLANARKTESVNIKNWIIDEDEDPEAHF